MVSCAHECSRRPLGLLAAALIVTTLAPRVAQAYILPADFLCRLVADSRKSSLKDVMLSLNIEVAEGDPAQEERLYLKRPERMRWAGPGDDGNILVVREGAQATFAKKALVAREATRDLLPVLLMPRGRDLDDSSSRMLEMLVAQGVDANVVSLGRHPDGVAYIVGAKVWEVDKPQVWIDKASYMPVRIRLPMGAGARAAAPVAVAPAPAGATGQVPMREVRLLNYAAGLPRLIEIYEGDTLVRRAEVTQASVNQNLPETLFDPREGRASRP